MSEDREPDAAAAAGEPAPAPTGAGAGLGCLGAFLALVVYWVTMTVVLDLVPSDVLIRVDPTGGAGMMLGIGPPAWLAVATAFVLALIGKPFRLIVGSGALVALASLLLTWLLLSK